MKHLRHQWLRGDTIQRLFLAVAVMALVLPLCVVGLLSFGYLALTVLEALGGTVLAPRAAMEYMPWLLSRIETIRNAMLIWAAVGAAMAWLASALPRFRSTMRAVRTLCGHVLLLSGLTTTLAIFLWVLALQWAGLAGSAVSCALLGLMPDNDPCLHWNGALNFLTTGEWDDWVGRRPVSAALRLLTLAGGSYAGILVVQTVACAIATWLATRSVSKRYGPWASIVFFALTISSVFPYLCSTLSETPGLTLTLLCMPMFIHGLCSRSLPWLMAGSAGLWFSLLCRMGAMFIIPCLGLWFLWICRDNKKKMGLVCLGLFLILFAGLAYNSTLKQLYITDEASSGSNFGYTFCGLTLGGDWELARDAYPQELLGLNETDAASFLYHKGLENLREDSRPFFFSLLSSVGDFFDKYRHTYSHHSLTSIAIFLRRIALIGMLYWVLRRRHDGEGSFYFAIMTGIVLSASVTMGSDGMRTMLNSFPFIWMLSATSAMTPTFYPVATRERAHGWEARVSFIALAAILTAGIIVPALVGKSITPLPAEVNLPSDNSPVLRGGNWMAGFLVMPDSDPLPKHIPAVHLSTLRRTIARQWHSETSDADWPAAPFAMLAASQPNKQVHLIIGDTRLLTEEAPWWKVTVRPSTNKLLADILYVVPLETMDITR